MHLRLARQWDKSNRPKYHLGSEDIGFLAIQILLSASSILSPNLNANPYLWGSNKSGESRE